MEGLLGAFEHKPDKEAVDTGASGMGTQMRQLGGIGKSMSEINPSMDLKRDGQEVAKERGGKSGA